MYVLLMLLGVGLGLFLVQRGVRRASTTLLASGGLVVAGTLVFFSLLDLLGELWWFQALGFSGRFWTEILARLGAAALGVVLALVVVVPLTFVLPPRPRLARLVPRGLALLLGAAWGLPRWDVLLLFLNRVSTGLEDPILGRDAGFYLFSLPFLDALFELLLLATLLPLAGWVVVAAGRRQRRAERGPGELPDLASGISFLAAPIALAPPALVLAAGRLLAVFHLLGSPYGAVHGPGWTDVHVRLPAYLIVAGLTVLVVALTFVPRVRRSLRRLGRREAASEIAVVALPAALLAAIWVLGLAVAPGLVQWLVVEPNEISFEKPYIAHNIHFTNHAFGLDRIEEREFPASETLDREMIEQGRPILSEVRLWDWRALDAVYKQFQEIRLYYEFADVDIDRYRFADAYREVMVSAREMEISNLPADSQTFVNRRFKYTHGYGLTLAAVSDFTDQGLPDLLVRDIPPVVEHAELEVREPSIYYGELTREYVVVDTTEEEFHYPRGDENAYVRYSGTGGVVLRNLWRKFVLGFKFDGTRFLLSGYPRADSRVLFHRQIRERLETLAPFLTFDRDPYVALVDGRMQWIVDAYTTATDFPYSEPFDSREVIDLSRGEGRSALVRRTLPGLEGVNYVRNAVKATIDAYDGTVTLYVFEPDDPIVRVWRRTFPDLFRDRDEMPEAILAHVRYPEDLLLAQGLRYAKYHMEDPEVFYNQEDLWVRATEKYRAEIQPVEPYYVMWRPAEAEEIGMVQILPFTPKNRQVLIGWIAGMCDPADYGRLLAYKFPKEKRVLGPQQVETKIDQDSYLSAQLSLWDQRGSQVIRGNVLAIPLEDTLLYVEPIYLRAETAAYPELRLVVVMHGDRLSYAESFEGAIEGLFEEAGGAVAGLALGARQPPAAGEGESLAVQAQRAFEGYLRLQGEGKLRQAGAELEHLRELLGRLVSQQGEVASEEPGPGGQDRADPPR